MISQYKVYGIIFHCYNDSGEKIKINICVGFIIKAWKKTNLPLKLSYIYSA